MPSEKILALVSWRGYVESCRPPNTPSNHQLRLHHTHPQNGIKTTIPLHPRPEGDILVRIPSFSPHPMTDTSNNRPSFTLTLIRSPFLPATYAKFIVPLNFNKLDIRDYLFHAYGVRVLRVRSFIEQQKIRANNKQQKYRPKAIKKMCVEMDKPFVWPETPEDFSLYVFSPFDTSTVWDETNGYLATTQDPAC
jgi:ribosomal protein L23